MTYKVVSDFRDLCDAGHQYKNGDKYPHTGEADERRVKQLMTPTSQRGALIEAVEEIVEEVEKPKTRRRKTSK